MQTLISGIEDAEARSLLDEHVWREAKASWIDPGELAQSLEAGKDGGFGLAWLYRSPMEELLLASEGNALQDVRGILDRWSSRNRAVLDFHRRGAGTSVLLNVERVRHHGAPPGILGLGAAAKQACEVASEACTGKPDQAALQRILELEFPEHIEVYEALEASSWLPDGECPWFRDANAIAPAELDRIVDVVASVPVLLRRMAALDAEVGQQMHELADERKQSAAWRRENELLMLQLRSMQEELRRLSGVDETGALRARIDELELQVKLLRKPLEHYLALLGTEDAPGLRARLARWLTSPGALALARSERWNRIEELRNSSWFDIEWYMENNKDRGRQEVDPVAHYYDWGWREGRDPGPAFSTTHYLRKYPDVVESGLNPLWHFVRYGEREGRSPSPAGSGGRS